MQSTEIVFAVLILFIQIVNIPCLFYVALDCTVSIIKFFSSTSQNKGATVWKIWALKGWLRIFYNYIFDNMFFLISIQSAA